MQKNNINETFNYSYDNRGNLIREVQEKDGHSTTVLSYDYDVTNKMVSGTNKDNISSIYNYNGLGVLVGNEIENINSLEPKVNIQTVDTNISKQFTIDYTKFIPSDLMEEYSDGISMKYAYVGRHKLSAEIKVNRQEEQKGQQKLFYHTDRLGSSVFISDINGDIKASANFDEWGNRSDYDLIKVGDKDIDLVKSYTGHNYDEILGVYYAKARMYNARDKRFLAEDIVKGEVGNPLTLVAYSYVLGNPLKYIDPDGLVSYVFYDPNIFGIGTGERYAKANEKGLKKYYGTDVKLVPVTSLEQFTQEWDNMGNLKNWRDKEYTEAIDAVVFINHANSQYMRLNSPTKYNKETKEKEDDSDNGVRIYANKSNINSEKEMNVGNLSKKTMDAFVLLGCNAAATSDENNLTRTFTRSQIVSNVFIGSDTTVFWKTSEDFAKIHSKGKEGQAYGAGFISHKWNYETKSIDTKQLGHEFDDVSALLKAWRPKK